MASRHNGVQLFISHLATWLRTRRFSEPTFRPFGATNRWKNKVFRDFPTFSRTWIFFLLILSLFDLFDLFSSSLLFSSLLFSSLLFSSLLFSDSSHLCFSSVHIVGSLTSKLPSNIYIYIIFKLYIYVYIILYLISHFVLLVGICTIVKAHRFFPYNEMVILTFHRDEYAHYRNFSLITA